MNILEIKEREKKINNLLGLIKNFEDANSIHLVSKKQLKYNLKNFFGDEYLGLENLPKYKKVLENLRSAEEKWGGDGLKNLFLLSFYQTDINDYFYYVFGQLLYFLEVKHFKEKEAKLLYDVFLNINKQRKLKTWEKEFLVYYYTCFNGKSYDSLLLVVRLMEAFDEYMPDLKEEHDIFKIQLMSSWINDQTKKLKK